MRWTVGLLFVLAGCASPVSDPGMPMAAEEALVDPLATGKLNSTLVPFELGTMMVESGNGLVYVLDIRGESTVPDGDGPFPVVLIMHGRHGTCATPMGEILLQPCAGTVATEPVASYTGYRYLAESMASHGIASVSIDVNNVNDHDNDYGMTGDDYGATARAQVLSGVADALEEGDTFADIRPVLDLDRIGIMGHSRGGEGVIRASTMDERFGTVFALAPTDFARWVIPADVVFATILPYCDGDVSNLQGAWAYDDTDATKHQFLHMGANHNFYNTIWTRDDWGMRGDPYCDGDKDTRRGPDEQRADGIAMMATFFRVYLANETDLMPFLDGRMALDHVVTSYDPGTGYVTDEWHLGPSMTCNGLDCPIPETYSTRRQAYQDLGTGTLDISGQGLPEGDRLTVRVGIHQDTAADDLQTVRLVIEDAAGRHAFNATQLGLFVPPGDVAAKTTLNMITVPLDGIDNASADLIRFEADAAVEIQVTDGIVRSP